MAADAPGPGLYLRELCEWKAESYSQLVRSQTKKGNLYRTWLSCTIPNEGIVLGECVPLLGKSLKSPTGGPPTYVLQAIPFLIRITGLAHLPHLPDQAIYDFHLIIGLSEILIQFSVPRQLDSFSELQFLAGGICMKIHKEKSQTRQ